MQPERDDPVRCSAWLGLATFEYDGAWLRNALTDNSKLAAPPGRKSRSEHWGELRGGPGDGGQNPESGQGLGPRGQGACDLEGRAGASGSGFRGLRGRKPNGSSPRPMTVVPYCGDCTESSAGTSRCGRRGGGEPTGRAWDPTSTAHGLRARRTGTGSCCLPRRLRQHWNMVQDQAPAQSRRPLPGSCTAPSWWTTRNRHRRLPSSRRTPRRAPAPGRSR